MSASQELAKRLSESFELPLYVFLVHCLLLGPVLFAQATPPPQQDTKATATGQATPEQPIGPLESPSGSGSPKQSNSQNSTLQSQPDTHPLSGFEALTTGSLHRLGSMFDPALSLSDFGYTGYPGTTSGNGNITSGATLGASFQARKYSGISDVALSYHGSDTYFYPYALYGPRNTPAHDFGIALEMPYRRWTVRLRNNFLYSWQAGFGGLFTGGPLQDQNSPLASLQPSLNPTGTILTGFARQVNNLSLGELDYDFSRRTTVTLYGSYGMLDFLSPGYLDSRALNASAGYNYALSAKNTIGAILQYGRTDFRGTSTQFDSDTVNISFGRKITGRLAVQLSTGPELTLFHNFGPSSSQRLSWNFSGSMRYQEPRATYSVSYFRGVTPGSGVFFGSEANTATASASFLLTRFWSFSLNGGYAVNNALVPNGAFADNFTNWFLGSNLGKQIGRHVQVALNYQYQKQITGTGACPVANCGVVPAYQVFGVTVNWHPWSNSSL